ncbi:MAG: mechanosensitive ion channel family protein [Candidatus Cloacimonadota bacterium]|nr:MAG: mechanosensitive ion channel family protein [Candidatus Cloacimonadota bacterium]
MHFFSRLFLEIVCAGGQVSKAQVIKQWFLTHGIRILFAIVGYIVIIFLVKYLTKRFVHLVEDEDRGTRSEREKRADSIASIINTATMIFFGIISIFMILREFNINITPLLTGAGVAGIAIGFAAQSVLKDFLHGFFLLSEDQIRMGDVVKIASHSGTVERITMRTTRLRGLNGHVYIIPNGQISTVENMTHGWSRAMLDIDVAYKENIDRVIAVIKDVAASLVNDEEYKKFVMEKPEVLGVQTLGDSGITIRLLVKTHPLKQWSIKRELQKRIKKRFDQEGIEIPFPQIVVHGMSGG